MWSSLPVGRDIRAVCVHPEDGCPLLQAAEAPAGADGVTSLHLDASLTAVPFYAHMGYTIATRHTHRLKDGTEIAAVAMRKTLA